MIELKDSFKHSVIDFMCLLVFLFATKQNWLTSRLTIFSYAIFSVVITYIIRITYKKFLQDQLKKKTKRNDLIVIADKSNVYRCVETLKKNLFVDYKVVGVVVIDADMTGESIDGIPVITDGSSFLEYVRTHVVDEVFIDCASIERGYQMGQDLIEMGITVHIAMVYKDVDILNNTRVIEKFDNYLVLTGSMRIATLKQMIIKRLADIIGSFVGLIFCGIAFIIFAPIIKIQSPGPVFYRSVRIGKNGRRFYFYKFRSMYADAEQRLADLEKKNEMKGLMFKMKDDPRITPIGKFLRKTSIDELPQFWNILIGDMSMVGTRPPTEREFESYENHHKARLAIKPGLTGMWQVSGRSDITDFEEVVKLDTYYIANWSLTLDVKIIFKTFGVVFSHKGSR